MLKIKLRRETEDSVNKIWYKIKLNGNIVDYGILHDIEETLGYVGLNFIPNKRNIISLSCSDEGTLIVKELRFLDSRAIAGERTSFNYYKLISGGVENINEVLNEDFSNVQQSSQVGFNKEWFFSLEEDQTIAIYDPEGSDTGWRNFPPPTPMKQGFHVYEFTDGTVYEGEFIDDIINGFGKMILTDGTILDGEFINGIFHRGTKTNPDNTKDMGEFEGDDNKIVSLTKGISIDIDGVSHIINKEKNQ